MQSSPSGQKSPSLTRYLSFFPLCFRQIALSQLGFPGFSSYFQLFIFRSIWAKNLFRKLRYRAPARPPWTIAGEKFATAQLKGGFIRRRPKVKVLDQRANVPVEQIKPFTCALRFHTGLPIF